MAEYIIDDDFLDDEAKLSADVNGYLYELIRCKDCKKHNKKVGFDENFKPVYKEDACPLVSWRGKAKGHEFDYQFCCCAERRADND